MAVRKNTGKKIILCPRRP